MKEPITSYVGLDIHKDSIAIAIAKAGRDAPQFIGTTVAQLAQVRKVLTRQKCTPNKTLVVYEAGPCGYGWARYLNTNGWRCEVISPAHVVRSAAGKAIKTDRRDALLLARESRAGNLTPIAVPNESAADTWGGGGPCPLPPPGGPPWPDPLNPKSMSRPESAPDMNGVRSPMTFLRCHMRYPVMTSPGSWTVPLCISSGVHFTMGTTIWWAVTLEREPTR